MVTKENVVSLWIENYCQGCDSETIGVDAMRPCLPCIADLSTLYCSLTEEYSDCVYATFACNNKLPY